ncbi:aldehyde dehydrogenase family protein [Frankia sp. CNm7]|uniref:aldehyde dehydrogenase (NAD(+)) n=1 Tax=Frankia nepalensis TaxID=1836974 RepID=A0A937RP83_9ACTN|nr:aldehyde dehydrogenase family protein [Frankia nepalensis]MBL7498537.1 aldehyde dehydrogenase family protein [Frankia nepalensis]MBL7514302.1 aldehyde dehydrogenase family protein [Frankia nepalensis]MBL7522505.1 aldehyde dehydrogenase family protein [Frankia nepalensis]MBL7630894.1 aldehyde dehydrogenase family protein [Frankia nepalensis]
MTLVHPPLVAPMIEGVETEGATVASTNPARPGEVVAEVRLAGPAVLVAAARVAKVAQRGWADVPAPVRGTVIGNFGRLVEDNAETLARLVTREVGKPLAEARGEVREIIDTCRFFLGEGRRLYGETVPSEMPDKQLFTFREPVGVMMVITAGNFPVAVPSWYLVPALLCGNAVVWKPAEYAAACARALTELAQHAGLPPGVLSMVPADGPSTADGLAQALAAGVVDKVGFTGSTAVGRQIGALCGQHLQTPCLELGGKNPMVVTPDADIDLAVEGALFGGFGTAGQRCTSLGTLIVHESVYAGFKRRFATAVENAPIGDPMRAVLYGPLLDAKFAAAYEQHLGLIRAHHTVFGSTAAGLIGVGAPRRGFVGDLDRGHYYHPVVVDGLLPDDELFREETFGPIVGLTTYRTLDEAIELANLPGYGLSSAIYTNDPATVFRFRRGISAGMVSVNNSTSGAEAHLPFGGNGRSGNGSRQSGRWVLDQVTRWQSVNWDYSGRLQKAQMDTAVPPADLAFRLDA